MRPRYHIAVSTLVAGGLYAAFRSWQLAVSSLVGGVLIDLDHILDYVVEYGLDFSVSKFFVSCIDRCFYRIFVLFHSWELLSIIGIAAWLSGWNPWVLGLVIGYGQHMLLDCLGNRPGKWGYFVLWRLSKGFVAKRTFPERWEGLGRRSNQ